MSSLQDVFRYRRVQVKGADAEVCGRLKVRLLGMQLRAASLSSKDGVLLEK